MTDETETQLVEIWAADVERDQKIYINGRWWRVLGNHQVEADAGPMVYIWREGNTGTEAITALEICEPTDFCVVKRRRR